MRMLRQFMEHPTEDGDVGSLPLNIGAMQDNHGLDSPFQRGNRFGSLSRMRGPLGLALVPLLAIAAFAGFWLVHVPAEATTEPPEKMEKIQLNTVWQDANAAFFKHKNGIKSASMSMIHNNLGGIGPDTSKPESILINVLETMKDGKQQQGRINITNVTHYSPSDQTPYLHGDLVCVTQDNNRFFGRKVTLNFELLDQDSSPVVYQDFILTFYDVDGESEDKAREYIIAHGPHKTSRFDKHATKRRYASIGEHLYISQMPGDNTDNPENHVGNQINSEQEEKSVSFHYQNVSNVRITLGAYKGRWPRYSFMSMLFVLLEPMPAVLSTTTRSTTFLSTTTTEISTTTKTASSSSVTLTEHRVTTSATTATVTTTTSTSSTLTMKQNETSSTVTTSMTKTATSTSATSTISSTHTSSTSTTRTSTTRTTSSSTTLTTTYVFRYKSVFFARLPMTNISRFNVTAYIEALETSKKEHVDKGDPSVHVENISYFVRVKLASHANFSSHDKHHLRRLANIEDTRYFIEIRVAEECFTRAANGTLVLPDAVKQYLSSRLEALERDQGLNMNDNLFEQVGDDAPLSPVNESINATFELVVPHRHRGYVNVTTKLKAYQDRQGIETRTAARELVRLPTKEDLESLKESMGVETDKIKFTLDCPDGKHNTTEGLCKTNQCFCPHGQPASGTNCPKHHDTFCMSCDLGFGDKSGEVQKQNEAGELIDVMKQGLPDENNTCPLNPTFIWQQDDCQTYQHTEIKYFEVRRQRKAELLEVGYHEFAVLTGEKHQFMLQLWPTAFKDQSKDPIAYLSEVVPMWAKGVASNSILCSVIADRSSSEYSSNVGPSSWLSEKLELISVHISGRPWLGLGRKEVKWCFDRAADLNGKGCSLKDVRDASKSWLDKEENKKYKLLTKNCQEFIKWLSQGLDGQNEIPQGTQMDVLQIFCLIVTPFLLIFTMWQKLLLLNPHYDPRPHLCKKVCDWFLCSTVLEVLLVILGLYWAEVVLGWRFLLTLTMGLFIEHFGSVLSLVVDRICGLSERIDSATKAVVQRFQSGSPAEREADKAKKAAAKAEGESGGSGAVELSGEELEAREAVTETQQPEGLAHCFPGCFFGFLFLILAALVCSLLLPWLLLKIPSWATVVACLVLLVACGFISLFRSSLSCCPLSLPSSFIFWPAWFRLRWRKQKFETKFPERWQRKITQECTRWVKKLEIAKSSDMQSLEHEFASEVQNIYEHIRSEVEKMSDENEEISEQKEKKIEQEIEDFYDNEYKQMIEASLKMRTAGIWWWIIRCFIIAIESIILGVYAWHYFFSHDVGNTSFWAFLAMVLALPTAITSLRDPYLASLSVKELKKEHRVHIAKEWNKAWEEECVIAGAPDWSEWLKKREINSLFVGFEKKDLEEAFGEDVLKEDGLKEMFPSDRYAYEKVSQEFEKKLIRSYLTDSETDSGKGNCPETDCLQWTGVLAESITTATGERISKCRKRISEESEIIITATAERISKCRDSISEACLQTPGDATVTGGLSQTPEGATVTGAPSQTRGDSRSIWKAEGVQPDDQSPTPTPRGATFTPGGEGELAG
eukprot:TRINITY_DN49396_c0_g1_i1.p1 TRINITY_DN49396_c0_g1~~TRINITY_DN49396_c0_g1_i1.p1  ORF type:complete len:1569 (-),score=241.80 TRINITY_DN49396_c0_g1_i1:96-4802(-)